MPEVSLAPLANFRRCRKPNCKTGVWVLHRHHRGHEKLFVDCLRNSHARDRRYIDLAKRYWTYDAHDCVDLCKPHHVEVHDTLYDPIITRHIKRHGKPYTWSWATAMNLRSLLRAACDAWLQEDTPGILGEFKQRTP